MPVFIGLDLFNHAWSIFGAGKDKAAKELISRLKTKN